MKDQALVVVDMLYDFIDGSMACQNGDAAVDAAVEYIRKNPVPRLFVCDNHPADHCSFTEQGGPWPAHCVQGTRGGQIHGKLLPYCDEDLVFYKGRDRSREQYSGFEGVNDAGQTLGEVLGIMDIRNVIVCGIATEYCVRNTFEDLRKAGFTVYLVKDALAYVDYKGHLEAMAAMAQGGARLL